MVLVACRSERGCRPRRRRARRTTSSTTVTASRPAGMVPSSKPPQISLAPITAAAASCSRTRDVRPCGPRSPGVMTSMVTSSPAATWRASAPPQPSSMSSGCAPMARTFMPHSIRVGCRPGRGVAGRRTGWRRRAGAGRWPGPSRCRPSRPAWSRRPWWAGQARRVVAEAPGRAGTGHVRDERVEPAAGQELGHLPAVLRPGRHLVLVADVDVDVVSARVVVAPDDRPRTIRLDPHALHHGGEVAAGRRPPSGCSPGRPRQPVPPGRGRSGRRARRPPRARRSAARHGSRTWRSTLVLLHGSPSETSRRRRRRRSGGDRLCSFGIDHSGCMARSARQNPWPD